VLFALSAYACGIEVFADEVSVPGSTGIA